MGKNIIVVFDAMLSLMNENVFKKFNFVP